MATAASKGASSLSPVAPEMLRPLCDPRSLGFKTTADLQPVDTLIGQERALGALRFGSEIDRPGYNLFALGPQGTGRHSTIHAYLKEKASDAAAPDDWVYVYNFTSAHRPQAMRLPAGIAVRFRDSMDELVDDLRHAIPEVFQSDEYRERRRAIDMEFEETQERAFEELNKKAKEQDVAILRTPMGFALAPVSEGQAIKPEVFNLLPKEQKEAIEEKISELQKDLTAVLEKLPLLQKQHRGKIRDLNAELTESIFDTSIKAIADRFAEIKAIHERLTEVRKDLVDHVELFLPQNEDETAGAFPRSATAHVTDPRFNRYRVNVMISNEVDGDRKGAPLVTEDHPTLANVVGRIEHIAQFGALMTDFTMIRPGALHRANGGYLMLDARKILTEPFSWEALKRALRSGTITIVSAAEELSLASTISLEPEPIPLKVKMVLIGERILYYLLSTLDPDFAELFKVEVDFDEELPRSTENVELYARLIASIAAKEKLLPFDASGVARVIEETARLAGDAERLSLRIGQLADLLREADFWAGDAKRKTIAAADVDRAVAEQIHRADRIRERSHEAIERGTVLIETEGVATGQVNGLSVISLGSFSFGRPSRITVRVRVGSGKVIDIERETKLGGPLHSKGVLILSGYLAANYARDVPMSLWASIVFEQSYGGVDGDSASSAELYALLSALAEAPINQALAITGSVNQYGQIQPIGGVNEKIEGFFDVCKARGLSGGQGVLIPASNVKHLMLRPDVVAAAKDGTFNIYPVETIGQGIELLTGIPAGERDTDGLFPPDSINGRVEARLLQFAESRKSFAMSNGDTEKANEDT